LRGTDIGNTSQILRNEAKAAFKREIYTNIRNKRKTLEQDNNIIPHRTRQRKLKLSPKLVKRRNNENQSKNR
jgi:hypothetical protein